MGLIYELLLVFGENCMFSACLLHKIQGIVSRWLRSMTDFNNICYHAVTAVIEFLTLKTV